MKWKYGLWTTALLALLAGLQACGGPTEDAGAPETDAAGQSASSTDAPTPAPAPEAAPEPEAEAATATATLYRDEWGVPHIYADTAPAAAYALGWAQAEDRLDDIYLNIRTGLGTYSEVMGKEHVQQDYMMQVARNAELAREAWEAASPEMKAIATRFIDGINAYLEENPDEQSEYAFELEPWQLSVIGRAMILRWPIGNILGDYNDREEETEQAPAGRSNEWAVHPSRTEDNAAILLTDPHLSWEGMSVFYEARVHGGDLHMNGFFLVGSPLMGYGHNQHIGWAPTTGGPDTGDCYKIKLKMGLKPQYEYDGEWRDCETRMITVNVKDGDPVNRPAIYTHLGPLISEPGDDGTAYVGATPYFEAKDLMGQTYKMCMAKNVDELYDAIGMLELMDQNLMFADTSGNIGYVRNGRTAIRPEGYDWNKPVPGWTSETAYQGIHPIEDLVQAMNPEAGYMQNCNISPANMMVDSPMTPDKYVDYIYNVSWDKTNPRGKRITNLLHEDDSVTEEEAIDYATNIYDIMAEPWQKAIRDLKEGPAADKIAANEEASAALDAILEWDGHFNVDDTATPVYKFWRLKCSGEIDVKAVAEGETLSDADQIKLAELLEQTIAEMKEKYGKWDVTWGDVHVVGRGGVYFPVPGADFGANTDGPNFSETLFDVRSSEDKEFPGRFIADNGTMSLMLMFFHSGGIESYSVVPWGQSDDPESPHYMDQGEKLFSKRQLKDTWWDREELEGHVASEKVFEIQ